MFAKRCARNSSSQSVTAVQMSDAIPSLPLGEDDWRNAHREVDTAIIDFCVGSEQIKLQSTAASARAPAKATGNGDESRTGSHTT